MYTFYDSNSVHARSLCKRARTTVGHVKINVWGSAGIFSSNVLSLLREEDSLLDYVTPELNK